GRRRGGWLPGARSLRAGAAAPRGAPPPRHAPPRRLFVSYLLDTNACIALVNGAPKVRSRFRRVTTAGEAVAVSAIVAFELWYGAARSARQAENAKRLAAFFAGPFELLAFDAEDARAAGEIPAELQAAGTPIAAYAPPIARHA